MLESCCPSQRAALEELERFAPGVPLLALGQTVFWDEPLKIGVPILARQLGHPRRFVAGIHDTDYFAKLHRPSAGNEFVALRHNDTTTKDLWSAAGEFSTLFGSETVVSKEKLQAAGGRIHRIEAAFSSKLDELTEAWGWRGVVSTSADALVAGQLPLGQVFDVMNATLNWAISETLERLPKNFQDSKIAADEFRSIVCDSSEPRELQTLGDYYEALLPQIQRFVSKSETECEVTRSSKLLAFNSSTCHLPRFSILKSFLSSETRTVAERAYNTAVANSNIYPLSRFGTGAIPFDLVVPGHGRGTIRIGNRGIVIGTPQPLFASIKKPITSIDELAAIIERKFGTNCALVGKAVTLITMLSTEYVFVFHEGGSGYVALCRKFHAELDQSGIGAKHYPLVRVRYSPWNTLGNEPISLYLPKEFVGSFGTEIISAKEFADSHRDVYDRCRSELQTLGALHKPIDLLNHLADRDPEWSSKVKEYKASIGILDGMRREIEVVKANKKEAEQKWKEAKRERVAAEIEKGIHWRSCIFEKPALPEDLLRRKELTKHVETAITKVFAARNEWRALDRQQEEIVSSENVVLARQGRRSIELEAELSRIEIARSAIISSEGLEKSSLRPSAWWFPIVSPNGQWFKETIEHAQWYLEHLDPQVEPQSE